LVEEMERVVIKRADSQGRIVLPKEWRERFNTDEFVLVLKEDKIEIYPKVLKPPVFSPEHFLSHLPAKVSSLSKIEIYPKYPQHRRVRPSVKGGQNRDLP